MGRSVSYPRGAVVVFDRLDVEDYDEDSYDDAVDCFRRNLCDAYPSCRPASGWLGNEDRIVAQNAFVCFGVSEYGGLLALWAAVRPDVDGTELGALGRNWLRHIAHRFVDRFGTMTKVGTFSNGGGVYAAKDVAHIPADNLGDGPGHVVIGGLLTDG